MLRLKKSAILLGLAWFVFSLAAAASPKDDTSKRINSIVQRMDRRNVEDLWSACTDLKNIAQREKEQAVELILPHLGTAGKLGKLGCAKTLIDLSEEEDAIPVLIELAGLKEDKRIRLASLSILGSTFYMDERINDEVEKFLNGVLEEDPDPEILVEAAKSLYQVSDHRYRNKARTVLLDMLKSDIQEIRVNAALALGEIRDIDAARSVLMEIQDDPSYHGRMAKILLTARDLEAVFVKRLSEQTMGLDDGAKIGQTYPGLDLLEEIITIVRERHIRGDQFDDREGVEKLLTAAAKGMLNYLDSHSTYFSQKEHERWIMDLERKYAGIGAYVNTIDGVFTIVRPIYSGPAYEMGLRSGDQIWKVDGWETFKQADDEIIRRLKGLPGSEVIVTIYRPGWKEERDFKVLRQEISIPSANGELLPGGIAYLEVSQFAHGTGGEVARKLKEFKSQGASGLILDLRNNSGGYLNEAINICSLFLPKDSLSVYTKGRVADKERRYFTSNLGVRWDDPMVVLVNHRSASASEIVSGALQHYKRALVVGEKTYGKGSVQNPMTLNSRWPESFEDQNGNGIYDNGEPFQDLDNDGKYDIGPMLKITSAMYYLPSGRSIHTLRDEEGVVINEGGVIPDYPVKYEGIESWKEEELADLIERKTFKDYVDARYDTHKDLFLVLAEGDDFDTSRYPGFNEFFGGLDTHLSRNDVRKWVRLEVRRRVQDDRVPPRPFPGFGFFGDYQEDSQLQAGIIELLKELNRDPHNILAYDYFADKEFEKPRTTLAEQKAEAKGNDVAPEDGK